MDHFGKTCCPALGWLHRLALGEPKTIDWLFQSTKESSTGSCISSSIPCHQRAGEVIKRTKPASSQRCTLGRQDNRRDLKEERFPPSGHSSIGRDDPERLCGLHPSGAPVQPGLCNLNYSVILQLHVFLLSRVSALINF